MRKADLFNLLCIPPYKADGNVDAALVATAAAYCEKRRAMLLVDPPNNWVDKGKAKSEVDNVGTRSKNAVLFFPGCGSQTHCGKTKKRILFRAALSLAFLPEQIQSEGYGKRLLDWMRL